MDNNLFFIYSQIPTLFGQDRDCILFLHSIYSYLVTRAEIIHNLPRSAGVVYAGPPIVGEPGVSDDELDRAAEERLFRLLPQGDPDRVFEHLPLTIVVEDEPQLWIDAARRLLAKGAVGRGVLEQVTVLGFTLLRSPSDMVDRETGIRIVELPPGQLPYPTHPTPDS